MSVFLGSPPLWTLLTACPVAELGVWGDQPGLGLDHCFSCCLEVSGRGLPLSGSLGAVAVTASCGVRPQPCYGGHRGPAREEGGVSPVYLFCVASARAPASHRRRLAQDAAAPGVPGEAGSAFPSPSEGGRRCLLFETPEGRPLMGETWTRVWMKGECHRFL